MEHLDMMFPHSQNGGDEDELPQKTTRRLQWPGANKPFCTLQEDLLRPERTEPEVLQNPKNGSTAEEGKAGEKTHRVRSGHTPGTHWHFLWKVCKEKKKTHL